MAPSPEYDKEPKAPDKSATNISNEDPKVLHNLINDQQINSDHIPTNTTASAEVENNKHVEALDDGQLRALLDEAITYKCPKDREGKSILFKELLEEVEQDEQECEARGRRALPHSNSLQDLVAALAAEPAPRHRHHHRHHAPAPAPSNVSARAIHGGSLPSGVNTSSMVSDEPTAGAGYLATVRCVNPPPLAERRVSASDANAPHEMDLLNRRSKPMFPMTYTARATLEIGSGSVCSGRAVTTTTASNQVDSAIPFSCITTPEVVASCNTTSSTSQSTVAVDPKPRSVISTTFNGLPLSRPNYGATASTAPEDFKKSLDENGNSVQGFSSPLSGSSQHKKPRRKKSSKNETVIDCEKIDGYQGDKDVNELLRFIESNVESARGHKLGRAKHKDDSDDKSGKKRSSERRKDKESKLKRASSLEELSRTKLEDLTDAPEPPLALRPDNKERRADLAAPKPERRSWGDDARDAFSYRPPDAPAAVPAPSAPPAPQPAPAAPPALASQAPRAPRPLHAPEPAVAELTDFQTVTKRRKQRRRTDDADPNPPPRRARHAHAPPSDRSNDSNDDLDSVHSLPDPAATAPRLPPPPPPPPQASYADIARTRHNIPDLIESCNFYAEGEALSEPRRAADPPPAAAPDAEGYPALEPRAVVAPVAGRRRDKPPAPPAVARRSGKERSAPPPPDPAPEPEPEPESPAPDVVGERRPPVILLDSASRPRDLDGVTFGFDINEQLLGGGGRRPRCDLVRDAVEAPGAGAGPGAAAGAGPGMSVRAGCRTLRYVPPNPPHSLNTQQVVDYVGNAWEELMRSGDKVRYYNE